MKDDFKTRMLRRHPAASNRPATLAVPDLQRNQAVFDIPVEGEVMTLDALVALSKNGHTVPTLRNWQQSRPDTCRRCT